MISKNFKNILDKNSSDDEIIEKSKEFAKSKLEKDLDEVKEHYLALSESLDAHIKGSGAALYERQVEKQQELDRIKKMEFENRKLKQELRRKYIKVRFFWWEIQGFIAIGALFLMIVFYVLIFMFKNWEFNYPHKIINWINAIPKDSMEHEIAKGAFDYALPIGGISALVIFIKNRLIDTAKRQKKLSAIEETVPHQYL